MRGLQWLQPQHQPAHPHCVVGAQVLRGVSSGQVQAHLPSQRHGLLLCAGTQGECPGSQEVGEGSRPSGSLQLTCPSLHSSPSWGRCRWWTVHCVPPTQPRSASRASASRLAATGTWAPRRSSTSAGCAAETIRAVRR